MVDLLLKDQNPNPPTHPPFPSPDPIEAAAPSSPSPPSPPTTAAIPTHHRRPHPPPTSSPPSPSPRLHPPYPLVSIRRACVPAWACLDSIQRLPPSLPPTTTPSSLHPLACVPVWVPYGAAPTQPRPRAAAAVEGRTRRRALQSPSRRARRCSPTTARSPTRPSLSSSSTGVLGWHFARQLWILRSGVLQDRAVRPERRRKSTPHACLEEKTTWDLVADSEKVRQHIDIPEWQHGDSSAGSTAHPLRGRVFRMSCSGTTWSGTISRRTWRRSPITSSSSAWLAPLADPSLAPTNLLLSLASSISRCCVFWKMEEEENLFLLN
ncbi:uncharacterized protein [Aegilops tauschii subsp. strangulata]|uniref:uncharacterized protein n=1 Tax=Aegilops tauschii subsp. strangulata TaxID=200361 RepID=UPI001ABC4414|nr:translation initiation factor IF-2 [Aegilops tauschii subsp. strangulata]